MQKFDSQRGEGAYFWRGAYFQGNTVIVISTVSSDYNSISVKLYIFTH